MAILVYGEIGLTITARSVVADLARSRGTVQVRINSGGGSVTEAIAICNTLRASGRRIEVFIDGACFSAATLVMFAGDTISAAANAILMFHAPWSEFTGNRQMLLDGAEGLQRAERVMADIYRRRVSAETVQAWFAGGEHWMDAQEAKAAGLIDRIFEPDRIAALHTGAYAIPPRFNFKGNPMAKQLSEFLNNLIESRVTQSRTRQAVIEALAKASGLTEAAVGQVLSGDTQCPDLEVLTAFAGVLEVEPESIKAAASADGCSFATAQQAPAASLALAQFQAAERTRRVAIRALFQPFGGEVKAMADFLCDDPTVSIDMAKERLLAALSARSAASGPLGGDFAVGDSSKARNTLQAAIDAQLLRANVRVANPHPAARDLRRMPMLGVLRTLVEAKGVSVGHGSPNEIIRAALTTSDLPSLLEGMAGKALQVGYEQEPASHRQWVRMVEVPDFKEQSRPAISEAPGLLEVLESGEFKSGALSDTTEKYKISVWGRILSISRIAIVNDDLDAFSRLANAFGASGARKEADLVYSILTSNPVMADSVALFHANHSNLVTGALSITSLGAARAAMRKQSGLAGEAVLNIVPKYLIVPATLETAAEQILASLLDPAKTTNVPNVAWIRQLELVVDARLDANSETAWYLAASTQQADTVELAHLEGEARVHTEERWGFERDVFEIKARMDAGAKAIDHRGLLKSSGV